MSTLLNWRTWAAGLLLASLAWSHWSAYSHGRAVVQTAWDREVATQQRQQARDTLRRTEASAVVAVNYAQRQAKTAAQGARTLFEVPNYVLPTDCAAAGLPGRWRVLLDAAAAGADPDAARVADAPTVPAESLAASVVANYNGARECADQVIGLQEWILNVTQDRK